MPGQYEQLEKNNSVVKEIPFVVKTIGDPEDRTLRFIASTEGVDIDDDIIRVAGWNLENFQKNPVILYMHNNFMPPIGKAVNVIKDVIAKMLIIDIKFPSIGELTSDIKNPHEHAKFADMIYNMATNGYIGTGSVGFTASKFKEREDQDDKPEWARGIEFLEQELLEFSITTVPANPDASMMRSMKSKGQATEDDIDQFTKYAKLFIELDGVKSDDDTEITKVLDPFGNPSTRDIERDIDNALKIDGDQTGWSIDIYPINYPNGHATVHHFEEDEILLHDYMYEVRDGKTVVTLGPGREVEVQMIMDFKTISDAKSLALNTDKTKTSALTVDLKVSDMPEVMKMIENKLNEIEKRGASISQKSKESIESAIGKFTSGIDTLSELINGSKAEDDPEDEDETIEESTEIDAQKDITEPVDQEHQEEEESPEDGEMVIIFDNE